MLLDFLLIIFNMGKPYQAFREKLEAEHKWPSEYMFKFILPQGREEEMYQILPRENWRKRASKSGNYESFTAKLVVNSSQEVIDIYEKAHKIEGLIAL